MDFMTLNNIIESIKQNLPKSSNEIKEGFTYIIEEGIIMNFSIIMNKLRNDLHHPLLVRISNLNDCL
jgi:hypothetical protein